MADVATGRPSGMEGTPEVELDIGGSTAEASTSTSNGVAAAAAAADVGEAEGSPAAAPADANSGEVGQQQKKREQDGSNADSARDRERELPPSKRARTSAVDAGRQRRLFGSITKTLSRFQEDTKKDSEASKRRAAVEERLAAKLREENQAMELKSGKEKARRTLRMDILRKEDERSSYIAVYKIRRDNKLHLANFLCTKHEPSTSTSQQLGSLQPPALPELPHALPSSAAAPGSAPRPLYYLPYKLLPWQADKIDGQMEDMKEALDKEEQDWQADLEKRDAEISELRSKLDEVNAEYARENGQEPRRGGGRRRSPSATAAKDRMEEDDASTLPGRAPLPERDDLEDDRGLGDYEEDSRDTAMQGAEGEEDVPAY